MISPCSRKQFPVKPVLLIFIRNKPRLPLPVMCHDPLLNRSLSAPAMSPVFIIPDQCIGSSTAVVCISLHILLAPSAVTGEQLSLLGSLRISSGSGRWVYGENLGPFTLGFAMCKKLLVAKEVQSLRCECEPSPCSQPRQHVSIRESKHKGTHFCSCTCTCSA